MIRSILNRSVLAAAFMLVTGQMAHAALSLQQQDVNDERTSAGMAYKAAKRSGEGCPFATKVARNANTSAGHDAGSAASIGGKSNGLNTVR